MTAKLWAQLAKLPVQAEPPYAYTPDYAAGQSSPGPNTNRHTLQRRRQTRGCNREKTLSKKNDRKDQENME